MKTLFTLLLFFVFLSCGENKKNGSSNTSTSLNKPSTVANKKQSAKRKTISKQPVVEKMSKLDSVEELKSLIIKAHKTNPKNWIKDGIVHPELGFHVAGLPASGIHIGVDCLLKEKDFIEYNEPYFEFSLKDDLGWLYKNKEHPNFIKIHQPSKYTGELIGSIGWGDGAFSIDAPEQRKAYLVLDKLYQTNYRLVDSLFYVLASKGLIDIDIVLGDHNIDLKDLLEDDFYLFDRQEQLRDLAIQVISNTSVESLDSFVKSIEEGRPNYDLITGKGRKKHKIGEQLNVYTHKYSGIIRFLRIDGKLYLYYFDNIDYEGPEENNLRNYFE